MQKAPVTWDKGIWDMTDRAHMGGDAIPTIYDANASGYASGDYSAGVGYMSDLYLSSMDESNPGDPWSSPYPSGKVWAPVISAGYFYLGQDEYYCYARKGSTTNTPTAGVLALGTHYDPYPRQGAPIVATLGVNEFNPAQRFARTYEPTPSGVPTRTPNKYRRRIDLTGRKQYEANASGMYQQYNFGLDSMQYTFTSTPGTTFLPTTWAWSVGLLPSGGSVTVEYELGQSGHFTTRELDLNPLNSAEVSNTMVVLARESLLVPSTLELSYVNRIIHIPTTRVRMIVALKNIYGCPISGRVVTFSASDGSFTDSTPTTSWDGTATTEYDVPNIDHGVQINVACGAASTSGWIPIGAH